MKTKVILLFCLIGITCFHSYGETMNTAHENPNAPLEQVIKSAIYNSIKNYADSANLNLDGRQYDDYNYVTGERNGESDFILSDGTRIQVSVRINALPEAENVSVDSTELKKIIDSFEEAFEAAKSGRKDEK